MLFSSLEFIFVFFPLFFILYLLIPHKFKNLWLFIASLLFVVYGSLNNPSSIILLVLSILVNYMIARKMHQSTNHQKSWLILGLIYNFGWLFIFKYADFLFSNINHLFATTNVSLPLMNLVLPMGISFYTFTITSYLIDVYQGKIESEKSLINFGAYVSMFPKLISGPIMTYDEFLDEDLQKENQLQRINNGLKTFTVGLAYKVILANQIGNLWKDVNTIGYESISTPLAWMGILAFSLQLYFDFHGYSLMAMGLGEMIGFKIPLNFNFPYVSRSMSEFWRRWHITLGSWFRNYVYIPLGGNRKGLSRTIFNLLVVWLFTGLWHGADWNFVLWGFVLFIILSIERLGFKKILDKNRVFSHLYMILLIPLTWLIFAISDFSELTIYFGRLFPFLNTAVTNVYELDFIKYGETYGVLLIIGILFSTPLPKYLFMKIKDNLLGTLILLSLFWLSIYLIHIGLNDPFMYFRF